MRTNITTFASLVMLTAALASCSKPEQADTQTAIDAESEVAIERPSYAITTDEAFSAADIAPYSGNHQKVYDHIDANLDSHIAELQRWLQQQSGSAENLGVREMAELILDDLRRWVSRNRSWLKPMVTLVSGVITMPVPKRP